MDKHLLVEFEETEKISLAYKLLLIIYFFSILVLLAVIFPTAFTKDYYEHLLSLPLRLITAVFFTSFIITTSILLVLKKTMGWILLTFFLVFAALLLLVAWFGSIKSLESVLNIGTFFFGVSLFVLGLLFARSVLKIFKITKKTILYTIICSILSAASLLLLVRYNIVK